MESMDYGMLYGQRWDCSMLASQRGMNKDFLTVCHSGCIFPLKKRGKERGECSVCTLGLAGLELKG